MKKRDSTRLSNISGMEVYSSEGDKIGNVKDIYLDNVSPKVYSWLITLNPELSEKLGRKRILVRNVHIKSMSDVVILDEKISDYLKKF